MKHARAFTVDLSVHCPEAAVLWALNCTPENMCTPEVDSGQRTGDGREERPARGDGCLYFLLDFYTTDSVQTLVFHGIHSSLYSGLQSKVQRETRKRLF